MKRALLIKFGAIGDVIMAIPAAHALHLQGYRIDWVCGRGVQPLLQCYPWINLIVADDKAILTGGTSAKIAALLQLWRSLAGRQYDLCATLYYDPRYRLMALPVRATRKFQLSRTDRDTRILPGRRHADELMRLLLNLPDDERTLPVAPLRPEILPASPLPRTSAKTRIAIAPAGAKNMMRADTLRRWPADNYVALASMLLQAGHEVVLIGGPDDDWVLPAFAAVPVTNMLGRCGLPETVALLNDCDLLISHDTGPLHLAGISSAGVVAIFGPTDPRCFMPHRPGVLAIWGGEGFACRPCYDAYNYAPCHNNGCMQQVTPLMVFDRVLAMLQQRAAGIASAPCIVTPPSTVPETSL